MTKIKLNFFRRFNKDMQEAVLYDAKNILKKRTKEKFFFGMIVFSYILSKPFYNQYSARFIRYEKIRKLKEEGLYVLE